PGMLLEGVVTNVTNFGAFVDIGVHQDGLVHISALSNTFVKDPHSVVKAGQVVKVKVLEVDIPRNRIALTMRLGDEAPRREASVRAEGRGAPPAREGGRDRRPADSARGSGKPSARANPPAAGNALAEAFARARGGK
ncbi:MAG TPA: RNA-binding transcriptional accessory protein, partial [Thauera sp.]|nr:RNA-binding transcriptional accessory protein [Thauera sp.]